MPQSSPIALPPGDDNQAANQGGVSLPSGEYYCDHYPNIELQITLSQRWAGCTTVLIDVVPYMLLVNQTPLDLMVVDAEADQQWTLPTNNTFAPPQFEVSQLR